MAKTDLSAVRLRELLSYNPETGIFIRLCAMNNSTLARIDQPVGWLDRYGYLRVSLDGKKYSLSRLAFLYMTGAQPVGVAEHRDGCRTNNRWSNLRDVSQAINMQNIHGVPRHSTIRTLGVSKIVGKPGYRARIRLNGKEYWLGTYATPEEAGVAYLAAKRRMHLGCTI